MPPVLVMPRGLAPTISISVKFQKIAETDNVTIMTRPAFAQER